MPYSIMLDAGHGGRDPGAVYNGRQEKDDALALTLAIGELLQERGIDILYTRTTDPLIRKPWRQISQGLIFLFPFTAILIQLTILFPVWNL